MFILVKGADQLYEQGFFPSPRGVAEGDGVLVNRVLLKDDFQWQVVNCIEVLGIDRINHYQVGVAVLHEAGTERPLTFLVFEFRGEGERLLWDFSSPNPDHTVLFPSRPSPHLGRKRFFQTRDVDTSSLLVELPIVE